MFDAACALCDGLVRFVCANDPHGRVAFLPRQSPRAALLLGHEPPAQTLVVGADGRLYLRSDAVLRLALALRAPWPLAFAGTLIPRALRDAVYDFIARNRYRFFGRRDACALPVTAVRERFLELPS